MRSRTFLVALALLLSLISSPLRALAADTTPAPAQAAEQARAALLQAQLLATNDSAAAGAALATAAATYRESLQPALASLAPKADAAVQQGLAAAATAIAAGDAAAVAAARAHVWTALLAGSYTAVEQSLQQGDAATAKRWLPLREFRHATKFSRPEADATLAVDGALAGSLATDAAVLAVRADLLDTYQARLNEALSDVQVAENEGFAARKAEAAALAGGYFGILGAAYREQRGEAAFATAQGSFAALETAARSGPLAPALDSVAGVLQGFRAAPLSAAEQARRAGQLRRFLSLVPVEYGRGVRGGAVAVDLEIREATTFRDGAAAAFADLRSLLDARDQARTAEVATLLAQLQQDLAAATAQSAPDPARVQGAADRIDELLQQTMPAEWLKRDNGADFDVIEAALDQMEAAAKAGQYELAESARLESYAILESGPEAKLIVFAPQFKPLLEGLFWYGDEDRRGLAYLIEEHAPVAEIVATRKALDAELAAAQKALKGNNAPIAVGTNAAVIVFREGLEAVLILAALLASLKTGAQRTLRRPIVAGAALALVASGLTWVAAQGALTMLARYGEKLEAVVSLIAIAMLLLITNWFFHDVYWKDWMASFHKQKKQLIGGAAGQFLGLVLLGFTSIYREGFETVLFLQALVLEAGVPTVLGGVGMGLIGTALIGLLVFSIQAKLPHKKMLIVTGMLIVFVLMQMVGNTVHVLQVVGWMPTHPIRWLSPYMPYWTGMWFGLYATIEGIALQVAAGAFTVGSYFAAEYLHKREQRAVVSKQRRATAR